MSPVDSLQRLVTGEVYDPDDDSYGAATQTWDLAVTNRPALVLVAATTEDIATGARWAAAHEYGIAILNTGHGAFSSNEGTLVISTRRLNAVTIDAEAQRATVGAGALWSDVLAAASPQGLVGATGSAPGVGVIGYTLGGGLGPLGRTLGFAADRVTALTVLDADYQTLHLDAHDEELFWALRGGGPLGIVTGLEFELASIPQFFGGGIYFDGADAAAVLSAYAAWVPGLDERTSTSIALVHLPPSPHLPPELRGRFVAHLRIAHVDTPTEETMTEGRRLLAQVVAAGQVISDTTRPMAPEDLPQVHGDPIAPQNVAYRGGFAEHLDASTIAVMVDSMTADPARAPRMVELRHLGGMYSHAPGAPGCSTGRSARFNLYVTASSTPDTATDARTLVDDTVSRISPLDGGQLNFYGPAPTPGDILRLWDESSARRLLSAATVLDPSNHLHTGRPLR
jgi:hypothetical protein